MSLLVHLPAPQTPPIPDFTVGVDLDGTSYTLRFFWDPGLARWYMRVLDDLNQNVLMGDTRLVSDWPLYRGRVMRSPPGFLILRDTTGQAASPTLDGLGGRWQLYYVTQAEVEAA